MDEKEIRNVARRTIIEMLDSIPGVIPESVCNQIQRAAEAGQMVWFHSIPLMGSYSISAKYTLIPNGQLQLEWSDWTGMIFWRGVFKPPFAYPGIGEEKD